MENNKPVEKYGLFTAIALVAGTVIGSGVFFKAEAVLKATGGDMTIGVLAWLIVGIIMIICSCTFATLATKYEKVNGIIDYAEFALGHKYGYYVGWFMTFIYYPTLTSVLAWVSARYLCVLIGFDITGGQCMVISCLFLIGSYFVNVISPILAGKFQVTTTIIKLIPLALMAVVGTIYGLANGITIDNFTKSLTTDQIAAQVEGYAPASSKLLASVVAVAFAYEGWIITTSINAELKNSKRNLPKALIIGSLIVVVTYILYYVGLAGGIDKLELIKGGQQGAMLAFSAVFGKIGGTLLMVFVVISCLGTLNGLMLGCCRGMYSVSIRGYGPKPEIFAKMDTTTNMPTNSSVLGLLVSAIWLAFFYGANLSDPAWFGKFGFDSSELPIITIYALYIPIFIMMIVKEKDFRFGKRFVLPLLAIVSCLFMIYAAILAHGIRCLYYLIIFVVVMVIAILFRPKNSSKLL